MKKKEGINRKKYAFQKRSPFATIEAEKVEPCSSLAGQPRRGRKRGWVIAVLAVLAAVGIALLVWGQDLLDGWQARQTEARLEGLYHAPASASALYEAGETYKPQASVMPSPESAASATPTLSPNDAAVASAPTPMPLETVPPIQADFQDLYQQNNHLIGWLRFGENVDSPVVWYDNDYYLHHDYFSRTSRNGVLFLNANNSVLPRDDVWLIHGHNMASGAMFGRLRRYMEYSYVCEYPLVMFRTVYDDAEVYYAPIAAFDASMAEGFSGYFDITQMVFENDDERLADMNASPTPEPLVTPSTTRQSVAYQEYLDAILNQSYWKTPVDVNVDDQLLMLVTCSYIQEDGRFILVCRKLRDDEVPSEIEALYTTEEAQPVPTAAP